MHEYSGSGKTGAYALPILQKILANEVLETSKTAMKRKGPRAVVLVPTRELVEQVRQVCPLTNSRSHPNADTPCCAQVFASLTHFTPFISIAALTADQVPSFSLRWFHRFGLTNPANSRCEGWIRGRPLSSVPPVLIRFVR